MALKLSLILGGLLIATASSSIWYIDRLQDQISVLKGNQIALESSIKEQNDSIKQHIAKQKQTQEQVNVLTAKNQEAQREVNKLKNTFAKHDLDNLALVKPKLIEKIVNKGTKQVKQDLIDLTNPNQFDNEKSTNS
jgi:biopolymer transport protein ExbB/TolQ